MQQSSSAWTRWAPPATRNLIVINFIIYFASVLLLRRGFDLAEVAGLHYFESSAFRVWQLLTYQFLHSTASIEHVLSNMFALYMFGSSIEYFWGSKRYLIYYLLCGISAGLVQELSWHYELREVVQYASVQLPSGIVPLDTFLSMLNTVGASGAVFGILLASGVLFPNSYVLIGFAIPLKMKYFVFLYGAFELFAGIHNTWGQVAHFAHLGGMIGGAILIYLWRKKGVIR